MTDKPMEGPTSKPEGVVEKKTKFRTLSELPGERMLADGGTPPKFVPDAAITEGDYLLVIYDPKKQIALASLRLGWLNEPDDPLDIYGLTGDVRSRIDESGLGYEVGDYYVKKGELDGVEISDAHDLGVGYSSAYKLSSGLDEDVE